MNIKTFRQTYKTLLPEMKEIIDNVNSAPEDLTILTKHIDRMGAIVQYSYYISLVLQYLSQSHAHVVDWGGSYGQITKLLQNYYPNTDCYLPPKTINDNFHHDYWHHKLDIKNVKYGKYFDKINYDELSVDAVISSGVLEHVNEHDISDEFAISEVNRILKSNGLFFIWNLPYQYGSVELLNSALGRWHHPRRYTKSEITNLLEKQGFEILLLDHHEFMNMMMRNFLGNLIGHDSAFITDYYLSKIPFINFIAQHFTIVARKMEDKN